MKTLKSRMRGAPLFPSRRSRRSRSKQEQQDLLIPRHLEALYTRREGRRIRRAMGRGACHMVISFRDSNRISGRCSHHAIEEVIAGGE